MKSIDKGIGIFKFIAAYILFGILWIFFSDLLLFSLIDKDTSEILLWGIGKGFIFLLVTSGAIFFILKNYSARLKKSNDELRRANNLYKALMEQSAEGVFRYELNKPIPVSLNLEKQIELSYKDAYLAECNNAMAKMYGYSSAQEMLGSKLETFLPISVAKSVEYLKAFIKSGYKIVDLESQEEDKFGNKKYFLNNLLGIIEDGKIARIWGAQRDITKIKEAEDAKKESEELYRTVIESMAEGLLITDVEDRILFANKRMGEISGYKIDEMVGKKGYEIFLDPRDSKLILEKNKLRLSNRTDTYEIQMRKKDGTKYWVRISGTPYKNVKGEIIGTLGTINDITDFKLAQKLVKESEDRYRSVVEQVNEVIYQTDSVGKLIFINSYWTQLTGYKINESIGRPLIDFIFSEDQKKISKEIISIIFNKKESAKSEARIITKDGKLKWMQINARLTRENYKIVGISGTITDIHERKLAEEELVTAKERAEESDRLKSVFLAQVSHEVRTPLNVVLNYNSIISEIIQEKLPGELDLELQAVENGGKRLMRTIDLILNMSLIQTGNYDIKFEKIDLKDLLVKLINEFNSFAKEKNLVINFDPENKEFFILGDEYTLAQTFQNLLDNALKYTEHGNVEIKIYNNGNNKINVDVKDTGIGISPEYMPNLFKPFSQEEEGYSRKFEGNGLGLALTKKYIELNNADIKVNSKKGEGTTFTVELNQF
ncbi:MAG TPA: PAS domain-containing sensor histidine kinase [Ignavibacteriaceae bacterium]|nr:PAS domain-containing sensor histidine kinase [Ignavibacteriaceae bacterium]